MSESGSTLSKPMDYWHGPKSFLDSNFKAKTVSAWERQFLPTSKTATRTGWLSPHFRVSGTLEVLGASSLELVPLQVAKQVSDRSKVYLSTVNTVTTAFDTPVASAPSEKRPATSVAASPRSM